jgi:hypothetical protein
MSGIPLFEEAKKAKEAAAAKASELAQQASDKTGDLKARTAAAAAEVKDQLVDQAADVKDAGLARVNELLEEFNAALPVLREAGYAVEKVDIQLGLPPRIVAGVTSAADVSEARIHGLIAENAERKLAVSLVKALSQARQLQSRIKMAGMQPSGLAVEVGLIPQISIKFARPASGGVPEADD